MDTHELASRIARLEALWQELARRDSERSERNIAAIRDRLMAISGAGFALSITAAVGFEDSENMRRLGSAWFSFGGGLAISLLLAFWAASRASHLTRIAESATRLLSWSRTQLTGVERDLEDPSTDAESAEKLDSTVDEVQELLEELTDVHETVLGLGFQGTRFALGMLIGATVLNVIGFVALIGFVQESLDGIKTIS